MDVKIEESTLVIKIDVNDPLPLSKSGKSKILASTAGNKKAGIEVDGKELIIGLNAYIPA